MNETTKYSTEGLRNTIESLKHCYQRVAELRETGIQNEDYIAFRSACLDRFQLILNQSGNLMKDILTSHGLSKKLVANMKYPELFDEAERLGLLSQVFVYEWMQYRKARNVDSHEYGEETSGKIIELCPAMTKHAEELAAFFETELEARRMPVQSQYNRTPTLEELSDLLKLELCYLEEVLKILKTHVLDAEVLAHGSRVRDNCWECSDLDLMIRQPDDKATPFRKILDLHEAFDESDIPIIIDLHDWGSTSQYFRSAVEQQHIVLTP